MDTNVVAALALASVVCAASARGAPARAAAGGETKRLDQAVLVALDTRGWPFQLAPTATRLPVALGDHVIIVPASITTSFPQRCFKRGHKILFWGENDDIKTVTVPFTWHPPMTMKFESLPLQAGEARIHFVAPSNGTLEAAGSDYNSPAYKQAETTSRCPSGYAFQGLDHPPALPRSVELRVIVCRAGIGQSNPDCGAS